MVLPFRDCPMHDFGIIMPLSIAALVSDTLAFRQRGTPSHSYLTVCAYLSRFGCLTGLFCDFSFLLPYFLGLHVCCLFHPDPPLDHCFCRACWFSEPRLVDGVYNTNFSISGVRPLHAFAWHAFTTLVVCCASESNGSVDGSRV